MIERVLLSALLAANDIDPGDVEVVVIGADGRIAADGAPRAVSGRFLLTAPEPYRPSLSLRFSLTDVEGLSHTAASVDLVLCNPPFHQDNAINDDVAWQMFTESKAVLVKGGELWVIGNRHLGYHAKLKHLFGNCEVVASNKKFTLLKSFNR